MASARLTPAARAEVDRLLALQPGATLSSVSTWADEVRSPTTARWHFVNFERGAGCTYDAAAQCPGGACVVGAIERQLAVLRSAAPDAERLKALKFVVHLVGDVHQPLHAGYADDKGGNTFQLQAFGRGTNLHALWDSALIAHYPGGEPGLQADAARSPAASDGQPSAWAEESCRIVESAEFYPAAHELPQEFAERWAPTLAQRIAAAGQRLAKVLNEALGR